MVARDQRQDEHVRHYLLYCYNGSKDLNDGVVVNDTMNDWSSKGPHLYLTVCQACNAQLQIEPSQ